MKRTISKLLTLIMTTGIALASIVSCVEEPKAKKAEDENQNKLHEMPARAVFSLKAVRVSDSAFDPNVKEVPPMNLDEPVQKIELKDQDKGFLVKSDNSRFIVRSTASDSQLAYILTIDYYAPNGAHMNHQFIDNGQDQIHQHFFAYFVRKASGEEKVRKLEDLPYIYRYFDGVGKDVSQGVLYASDDNPLGFKGLIRFTRTEPKEFNITLELLHAYDSKFLKDGKPSSFHYIHGSKAAQGRDINIDIPISVIE